MVANMVSRARCSFVVELKGSIEKEDGIEGRKGQLLIDEEERGIIAPGQQIVRGDRCQSSRSQATATRYGVLASLLPPLSLRF